MEQEMPDYETICAAVVGEKWALEKVLDCYGDEINRLAMVKKCQPDGTIKEEIDEDLRQTLIMKLLEAIPQFPMEKERYHDTRRNLERLFQEKRFARRYCIVFILHVQEHLYRGRVDQLLLCMAVLRYPLWHSPYVRMACTAWI